VQQNPPQPAAVKFIFLTLLLDVIGFGLLIPVAPKIIERLLASASSATAATTTATDAAASDPGILGALSGSTLTGTAASAYGALLAMYALMQFLFAPVLGALSDRFGRRPVILISLAGSAIDYIAMALSPTLWFLYLTRAINGISGANFGACNAYVADVTPPEKRAAAFGMIGAAFGIGFIIGPALGGLLASIDIHLPFFVAAGLTAMNWLYGYFVLPESLPPERRRPFTLARANPLGSLVRLAQRPVVLRLAYALTLWNLAMYALHATWVLYTAHRYNWSPFQIGLSLACVGLGAAVVQGGLVRKIVPALGETRSILLGGSIATLAYAGYGLATEGFMIYVIILFASLGGIAGPALQSLVTRAVSPSDQGEVQGSLTSLASLMQIAGPLMGANIFRWSIAGGEVYHIPGAAFLVCAALALLGTLIAWYSALHLRSAHAPAN
jgi:DHA1 family tetracycline resistance protein-like MFS transporter